MNNESKTGSDGLDPKDDEALWDLLGWQAPPVKASPYFARRVLREVALAEERRGGWAMFLRRFWLPTPRHAAAWSGAFALGGLCLSAVLTIPASRPPLAHPQVTELPVEAPAPAVAASKLPPPAPEAVPFVEAAPAAQDVEMIADLDNLLDREESRLWTEESDTARF